MGSTGLRRVSVGDRIDPRDVPTADGTTRLPTAEGLTHLQFRRFAGCAICAHHLRPFVQRRDELDAAGVTELIAYRSDAERVTEQEGDLPFTLLPDPDGELYAEFGVESALRSLLKPQAWIAFVRGAIESRTVAGSFSSDDHLGLPADLLLDPEGQVFAVEYGDHAAAGWSVDRVLELARRGSSS